MRECTSFDTANYVPLALSKCGNEGKIIAIIRVLYGNVYRADTARK